jgi:hypothetical protein
MRHLLDEADRPEGKTLAKVFLFSLAQDQFSAPAADIHQEQGNSSKGGIGSYPLKNPIRLLISGDDLDLQSGSLFNRGGEVGRIACITRGAGGDRADGGGVMLASEVRKFRDGSSRGGDGFGLQAMSLVKAAAKPSLFALLEGRKHVIAGNIGNQQFDRVGADINDSPADGLHKMKAKG